MDLFSPNFEKFMERYKLHILVFLVALLAAIFIAHPAILVNDEWISTNQLNQLNEGHQIILNEGKYGVYENGTSTRYFEAKDNYLAYPLFLPIISLPSEWLVYYSGDNFVYIILYLWTFLLIALALLLNTYFPKYTYAGKWRWTTGLIIGIFILFIINLYLYGPFPLMGKGWYPEVMAIAFTNIILFACIAVMIYEICRTLFEDPTYSFFGTIVCLSCSSYLFWTNFCKDHVLVAFIFTLIVLMLVKFIHTDDPLFISTAFILSGLLAWARPELALFVFIFLCVFIIYTNYEKKKRGLPVRNKTILFIAPLFTIIGAIPFCLNNYLFTKNIFVPAWILWKPQVNSTMSAITGSGAVQPASSDTLGSLVRLFLSTININPATFFSDLYGVLLNPQSGSMGLLPLVPLFLIALLLVPVFLTIKKISISWEEKDIIVALVLIALGVFLAYARGISGMNISIGIVPDMRYMSPIYLPLNLLGLMAIRKLPSVSGNPNRLLTGMGIIWVILLPVTLILMAWFYPSPEGWGTLFPVLDAFFSLGIYLLIALFLLSLIANIVYNLSPLPAKIFLALLCALPFIWQINATVLARLWGTGLGGYSFWIPVMLNFFSLVF
jgi:hypothetical protein